MRKKFEKGSQCRTKLKGGPFGIFQHLFCCKTPKKYKGDPLLMFFFRKERSHNVEKSGRWDPLVSPGIVCYTEEKEKLFFILFARPNGLI